MKMSWEDDFHGQLLLFLTASRWAVSVSGGETHSLSQGYVENTEKNHEKNPFGSEKTSNNWWICGVISGVIYGVVGISLLVFLSRVKWILLFRNINAIT